MGQARNVIDGKCVITKTETMSVLGVRHPELPLFESAARVPKISNRKGYTFKEYKRLLEKVEEFYGQFPRRDLF